MTCGTSSDRMLTKRWSTETVRASTTAATQEVWFGRVLPIDMWEYFRAVPGCSDEYWDLLRAGTTEFWNPDTVPFEQTSLPLRQRLMGWLVCQGRRSDLAVLIDFIDRHPEGLPRRRVGDREVVDHPFAQRARPPAGAAHSLTRPRAGLPAPGSPGRRPRASPGRPRPGR